MIALSVVVDVAGPPAAEKYVHLLSSLAKSTAKHTSGKAAQLLIQSSKSAVTAVRIMPVSRLRLYVELQRTRQILPFVVVYCVLSSRGHCIAPRPVAEGPLVEVVEVELLDEPGPRELELPFSEFGIEEVLVALLKKKKLKRSF
jgi:hypothetical protein